MSKFSKSSQKAKTLKKRSKRFRLVRRVVSILILGLALGVVGTFGFYFSVKWGFFGLLPDKEALANIQSEQATRVYSVDNKLIGKIFSKNRSEIAYKDLPQNLINALIATEDARFYEHEGIDEKSLLRVLVKNILLGNRDAGGGSTITQQLVKNIYGRESYGFLTLPVNKVREIILAQRLEEVYSKEEIIALYLNTVAFSENVYGVAAASQRFFSQKPQKLKTEEAAVLVGLLKANTLYNPRLHPEKSQHRRNVVLHQMGKYGYLEETAKDSLQQLPLKLDYKNVADHGSAPYFMDQVKRRLRQILSGHKKENGKGYELEKDGLQVTTTLHSRIQEHAQEAVADHMKRLQKLFDKHWKGRAPWYQNPQVFERALQRSSRYQSLQKRKLSADSMQYYLEKKHPVEVYHPRGDTVINLSTKDSVKYYLRLLHPAVVSLNPGNGAVLSWVGGRNFRFLPYGHVLAKRQAASAFKPIVYATALEQGIAPCDFIETERRMYEQYQDWSPRNYDEEYEGLYSMAGGLKKSVNTVAVKLLLEAGIDDVQKMARQMGIESELPDDPTLALGSGSVSPLELTQAYAAFANGGKKVEPYFVETITNAAGDTLYEHKAMENPRILKKQTATLMNEMLQNVVNGGTGHKIRTVYGLRNELAGKTGTAQNYADGWFVGYTPDLVTGVWVGANSPAIHFRSGSLGSGSAMALPIFAKMQRSINAEGALKTGKQGFQEPSEEVQEMLDCPDYRDKNLFDKVKDIFDKDKGQKYREEETDKGFFDKIFGE